MAGGGGDGGGESGGHRRHPAADPCITGERTDGYKHHNVSVN